MKKLSVGKLFLYVIGGAFALALAVILMPIAALAGAIGTWYFSKKQVDPEKKNFSLGLLVVGLLGSIFLTPMAFKEGENQVTVPPLSSSSTSATSSSSNQVTSESSSSSTEKATKESSAKTESSSVQTETSASSSSTSETESSETAQIKEVSAEELYDMVSKDSFKVGDVFNFKGKLQSQEQWGIWANGHYTVLVGNDNPEELEFTLLTTEKEAEQWTDGTEVLFEVEVIETKTGSLTLKNLQVKSSEILSGGTTKEAKEEARKAAEKAKLAEYFTALQTAKDTINAESGMEAITSIDPGYADHAYHVNLSIAFLQVSTPEAKVLINKLNETLVSLADQEGLSTPQFSYYIEGTEVGENRIIMNPYEVKFKKILD